MKPGGMEEAVDPHGAEFGVSEVQVAAPAAGEDGIAALIEADAEAVTIGEGFGLGEV